MKTNKYFCLIFLFAAAFLPGCATEQARNVPPTGTASDREQVVAEIPAGTRKIPVTERRGP
jgi:hypothetical protein